MEEDGYITAKQQEGIAIPASHQRIPAEQSVEGANGYLPTMVQNELIGTKAFSKQDLETGGYKIVTTIDKSGRI